MSDEERLFAVMQKEIERQYSSQKEFASLIGISPTTLSTILHNSKSKAAFATVLSMCQALGISVDVPVDSLDEMTNAKILYGAYKAHPEMQAAVCRLLGIDPERLG
ncbi:helix-turn-helix transcriptional regulator [uncultured Flavonifractor sp.]|uniref:helix-turn-helix domain-containing protein n=1 Tax=uncultured Flavonifractor sp. TaxID=1193534 RepID=UPI002596798E|nr:helix-turn-helix transcriptional regulator [uncultured Flavonifractor sp.]